MVRVKQRYIVVVVDKEFCEGGSKYNDTTEGLFIKEILDTVRKEYGEFGYAALSSNMRVKFQHSNLSGFVILRVKRAAHSMVMAAIPCVMFQGSTISCCHVSGTMRHALLYCEEKLKVQLGIMPENKKRKEMSTKENIDERRKKRVN